MQTQPIQSKTYGGGLFPANQQFARIAPNLPKDAPKNIRLPQLEKADPEGDRRYFAESEGFVPVSDKTAIYLRRVHVDGETSERGGKGPLLFQVAFGPEAAKIAQEEERRSILEKKGGSVQHAELAAYLTGQQAEVTEQIAVGIAEMTSLTNAAIARADAAEARVVGLESKLDRLTDLLLNRLGDAAPEPARASAESTVREAQATAVTVTQTALPTRPAFAAKDVAEATAVLRSTPQSPAKDPEADVREYVPPVAKHVTVDADGTVQDFAALARERG